MYCFGAPHKSSSYTDSFLHEVCNLSLNSDKRKYMKLATPLQPNTIISYTCIDVQGDVQMYWGCIDVQGACRCIGAYRYTEEYRCMEDVWEHKNVQRVYRYVTDIKTYKGHTDVMECTDVFGMYICIGEPTDVWGMYRCMGCREVGGHTIPPDITDRQTYPSHMPANYTWVLYFL